MLSFKHSPDLFGGCSLYEAYRKAAAASKAEGHERTSSDIEPGAQRKEGFHIQNYQQQGGKLRNMEQFIEMMKPHIREYLPN